MNCNPTFVTLVHGSRGRKRKVSKGESAREAHEGEEDDSLVDGRERDRERGASFNREDDDDNKKKDDDDTHTVNKGKPSIMLCSSDPQTG